MAISRVINTKSTVLSPWVTLLEKDVKLAGHAQIEKFHSLKVADYTNVIAVTSDRKVVLVRQFRPGIELNTIEFPGGLVEGSEEAAERAAIEFREETGLAVAAKSLKKIAELSPCPARLENRIFGYFVDGVGSQFDPAHVPEPGVDVLFFEIPVLLEAVKRGEMMNAQHVALLGLAIMRGLLK